MQIGPGVHRGISYEEYAAWPGIRKSDLWPLVRMTPGHYKYRLEHPTPPTPEMEFGSAFHCFILEPERFKAEYTIGGPINPKTGKAYGRGAKKWAEWEEVNPGITAISEEDYAKIQGMTEAVCANLEARSLLAADGQAEVSILWKDPVSGRLLQGRLDHFVPGAVVFTDVKTTRSVAPHEFNRSCSALGYWFQLSLYWDGLRELTGQEPYKPLVIAVEKEEPYWVAVRELKLEDLDHGRTQYREALALLDFCEKAGEFPSYQGIEQMEIPSWDKASIE